jgi:hypothetical protein
VDDAADPGGPPPPAAIYGGALGELDQLDQAVYRAIAATPSPSLDQVLSRLSSAADHSKLWFAVAVAAALALKPGRPRRAAVLGVASIGLASATANLVGKGLLRRARPDRAGLNLPAGRKGRMPGSTSFPSGHSGDQVAGQPGGLVAQQRAQPWQPTQAVGGWLLCRRGRRLLDRGHPLAAAPALGLLGGVTMSGSAGTATSMTLAS